MSPKRTKRSRRLRGDRVGTFRRSLQFERLEERILLSMGAYIDGTSTLVVLGGAEANQISLRLNPDTPDMLTVEVDDLATPGTDFIGSFNMGSILDISVSSGGGNDSIWIDESGGVFTDIKPTTLRGGEGDDMVVGGSASETLTGSAGNDTLSGGGGDDRVYGHDGDDILFGGAGNDKLYGQDGNDQAYGDAGDDSLYGYAGDDRLYGGAGQDKLYGHEGNDLLSGDSGPDSLYGYAGADSLYGGDGADRLYGHGDNDLLYGDLGNDSLYGGDGDDILWGRSGDDSLRGESGSDVLLGSAHNDLLKGDMGRDLLIGGTETDELRGYDDGDILIGGTTAYDDDIEALGAIVSVWASQLSYEERIATLEDRTKPVYLEPDTTVLDDEASDTLRGYNGRDWFFWFEPDVLYDRTAIEIITHRGGHDHPVLDAEHDLVTALVRGDEATHIAITTGPWSDPATWQDGLVPGADANAFIEIGVTVTVDGVYTDPLRTLRVDGALVFDPTIDTQLTVDTVFVSPGATFVMGWAANPIADGYTAKLLIADRGPIDPVWDPGKFSRGMIAHGTTVIYGAYRTPWLALAQTPSMGDTQLELSEIPVNWKVGDQLVVTGTNPWNNQDEVREILVISGSQVTISPLDYNHHTPDPGLSVYVANMSRNAIIESENQVDIDRRGHLMFMHSENVSVQNAGFYGLGRTNKAVRANDPVIDDQGRLVEGTGTNARGRYAVHFHRTGINPYTDSPAIVQGSAVWGSPGWGFVNHSSNVNFEDNVAFDVVGAAFVTEAGEEFGAFRRNLAIRTTGSGEGLTSRESIQDFGHQGDGFWFQGAGIHVEDNIAVGHRHTGFIYFTRGLIQPGMGRTEFLADNLLDPSWANGKETLRVRDVPVFKFQRNVAYASNTGFESWFHLLNAKHDGQSVIEDLTVWNTRTNRGIRTPYTRHMTLRNVHVYGNDGFQGIGISRNGVTNDFRYENVQVDGRYIGLNVPLRGDIEIQGGYFNNVRNLRIYTAMRPRTVNIASDVQFGTMSPEELGGRTQYDIYMQADLTPSQNDLSMLFQPDAVLYNGQQVYFNEQAQDYVLFPADSAPEYVPTELIGKTNLEIWDTYGLALGDAVAPADATVAPRIQGLVGTPATYRPSYTLRSTKYTSQLAGYELKYSGADGVVVTDPELTDLKEGWNLISRTIDGNLRTFMVFGDVTPPTFEVHSSITLEIEKSMLSQGFYLRGYVHDNSTGRMSFKRTFTGLDELPIQTRVDGTEFVLLEFTIKDRAKNTTDVALELTVLDLYAPHVVGVYVHGTGWDASVPPYPIPVGSDAQLQALPWMNIDQISVVFNEDVVIDQGDLSLSGVNVPSYAFSGFLYDAVTFTATWTVDTTATPLDTPDKLSLVLNAGPGGVTDKAAVPHPLDGNAAGGDNFQLGFDMLVGDVNDDRAVSVFDALLVSLGIGTSVGDPAFDPRRDVNADGAVNVFDALLVRLRIGDTPPEGPAPALASAVAGASGGSLQSNPINGSGAGTSAAVAAADSPELDPDLETAAAIDELLGDSADAIDWLLEEEDEETDLGEESDLLHDVATNLAQ